MSLIIKQIEEEQIAGKKIPRFNAGDSVAVKITVQEGDRKRLQTYEGIVIAKRNRGINSSFTVRKISHDSQGVERVFQTYSPQIHSIKVKRLGAVRRAKIYYLRNLQGRKARIPEKRVKKISAKSTSKQESEKKTKKIQEIKEIDTDTDIEKKQKKIKAD